MTWDKEGLREEVEALEDGTLVNWSSGTMKYKITNKSGQIAKNGGQIAQEYLVNKGVNIHRFKKIGQQKEGKIIRKKLRGS